MNNVLVVGASGRVGCMLARGWAAMGLRPVFQHRGAALAVDLPQMRWSPLDHAMPPQPGLAAMIVLAGVVPGRGDLADNARIARACLAAAESAGIGKVMIASSSAVYGSNGGMPFAESDATMPVNPYGRAKLQMEAACDPWRARGMQICALRIGNVAGADALLLNAATGDRVLVDRFADGAGPLRSYIGARTMARVLADLVTCDLPEVLNLAAPVPVAMADLAQAAGADWQWQAAPEASHQRITMDCRRLSDLVAFSAHDSLAATMVAEWQALRGAP